jgi:hypothetical protein
MPSEVPGQVAITRARGISSHIRPSRMRPFLLLFVSPHCLKKKGTPAAKHWLRISSSLFQVVARRYLKGSIILTTNRGIPSWGQIFDDPMVAAAMLDRLLHKSVVLQIDGESYRMREHRARAEALRKGVMHTATTAYHVCPTGLLTWGISVIEPGEFPRSPSMGRSLSRALIRRKQRSISWSWR